MSIMQSAWEYEATMCARAHEYGESARPMMEYASAQMWRWVLEQLVDDASEWKVSDIPAAAFGVAALNASVYHPVFGLGVIDSINEKTDSFRVYFWKDDKERNILRSFDSLKIVF